MKHLFTLLAGILIWAGAQGQLSVIQVFEMDTVTYLEPVENARATLLNTSTQPVQASSITLAYFVNVRDTTYYWSVDSVASPVPSADTATLDINPFTMDQQQVMPGGVNIVVVWPEAPGFSASDSFVFEVFVKEPTALDPESDLYQFKVFPNPSAGPVQVETMSGQQVERVRIFNLQGQLLLESQENHLDLSEQPAGLYSVEAVMENGRRYVRKLYVVER